jgi:hypothetical protein
MTKNLGYVSIALSVIALVLITYCQTDIAREVEERNKLLIDALPSELVYAETWGRRLNWAIPGVIASAFAFYAMSKKATGARAGLVFAGIAMIIALLPLWTVL